MMLRVLRSSLRICWTVWQPRREPHDVRRRELPREGRDLRDDHGRDYDHEQHDADEEPDVQKENRETLRNSEPAEAYVPRLERRRDDDPEKQDQHDVEELI